MQFKMTPESLALMAAGTNMMAAGQGGNTDLTKQGLGYALQQGLQGGLDGAKLGQQLQDSASRKQWQDSQMSLLQENKPTPHNPYAHLTPQQRAMASNMIMSGDHKGFNELLKPQSGIGLFKNMNEYLKSMQTTRSAAQKSMAPSNESLRKFGQATDLLNKRDGFNKMTGADDTVLMKAFASMILPGEAVMSDDINIIAQQDGLPGWFKSYAAQLQGNGQLSPSQRADIYQTMTPLAERANQENQQFRNQYGIDKKLGQFPDGSIFSKPIGFNPYKSKAPQVTHTNTPQNPLLNFNRMFGE